MPLEFPKPIRETAFLRIKRRTRSDSPTTAVVFDAYIYYFAHVAQVREERVKTACQGRETRTTSRRDDPRALSRSLLIVPGFGARDGRYGEEAVRPEIPTWTLLSCQFVFSCSFVARSRDIRGAKLNSMPSIAVEWVRFVLKQQALSSSIFGNQATTLAVQCSGGAAVPLRQMQRKKQVVGDIFQTVRSWRLPSLRAPQLDQNERYQGHRCGEQVEGLDNIIL